MTPIYTIYIKGAWTKLAAGARRAFLYGDEIVWSWTRCTGRKMDAAEGGEGELKWNIRIAEDGMRGRFIPNFEAYNFL